ncbi:MAG: hypothetical protein ACI4S3_07415 [Candidatus Gastranaerophilaceae bacterium]
MKYRHERRFLEYLNLTPIYLDEFLTFSVLNDIEKKIVYYVFKEHRSIRNIANLGLLNYEKSQLYKFYENGLSKINKWIKTTERKDYILFYKISK